MRKNCCKKALTEGILLAAGHIMEDGSVYVAAERTVSLFAARFFAEQAGHPLQPVLRGRQAVLHLEAKSAAKYLSEIQETAPFFSPKCTDCAGAFLRGIFLACGRVGEPASGYRLEFEISARPKMLQNCLAAFGFPLTLTRRRTEQLLLSRNSEAVESILVRTGAAQAAFALMNRKIEQQIKNDAVRRGNCEVGNIAKTVGAAQADLSVLRELEQAGLLSSLLPEMEVAARLRLDYPEYSLSQLGSMMPVPIGKSGMRHRLTQTVEYGKNLLRYSRIKKQS